MTRSKAGKATAQLEQRNGLAPRASGGGKFPAHRGQRQAGSASTSPEQSAQKRPRATARQPAQPEGKRSSASPPSTRASLAPTPDIRGPPLPSCRALVLAPTERIGGKGCGRTLLRSIRPQRPRFLVWRQSHPLHLHWPRNEGFAPFWGAGEIGRASCRERGWVGALGAA